MVAYLESDSVVCGISGAISSINNHTLELDVSSALRKISHRGPDDQGTLVWDGSSTRTVLGSTRLAVQDISSAGHMPMESSDKRFAIVFNGEITNFIQLRKQLQQLGRVFRSAGDTEVLLQAWEQWGEKAIVRFEGMFAFAILDRHLHKLFLARDSFGIKPLFFSNFGGEIHFGSEISAILTSSKLPSIVNQQVAIQYLLWGQYEFGKSTFFQNIERVLPGELIEINLNSREISRRTTIWRPSVTSNFEGSFDEASKRVRELFFQSVENNLISDVPLGIALSGGVDSSAIVCAARKLKPNQEIHTFSFAPESSIDSELDWINLASKSASTISTLVRPSFENFRDQLDELILLQGEPFMSTSIYAQYKVFESVHDSGITVTLDGQGADEIFGGYHGFPVQRTQSLLADHNFLGAINFLWEWSKWPERNLAVAKNEIIASYLPKSIRALLRQIYRNPAQILIVNPQEFNIGTAIPEVPKVANKTLKYRLTEELVFNALPALLRHGDRNSMYFSVESRVPFLDKELVNFVYSLPEDFLVSRKGETKHVFREAMRGTVPDKILDRKDKIGFSAPDSLWLRGILIPSDEEIQQLSFLNFELVKQVIDGKHPLSRDVRLKWRLLNLIKWFKIYQVQPA